MLHYNKWVRADVVMTTNKPFFPFPHHQICCYIPYSIHHSNETTIHRDWEVTVTGNIIKRHGSITPQPNVPLGPTSGSIIPISYLLQNTGVTTITAINVSTLPRSLLNPCSKKHSIADNTHERLWRGHFSKFCTFVFCTSLIHMLLLLLLFDEQ